MNEKGATSTASTREAAPSSRRGGRCCSLGCGGCLILLALLALGAWFGYTRFGAPWLETKAGWLIHRIPSLERLLDLKDSFPLRGTTLTGGGSGSREPGAFPADVWLPSRADNVLFNTGETFALAAFLIEEPDIERLVDTIRREMDGLGWESTAVPDPSGGSALFFEKADRTASYTVVIRDESVRVVVKVGRAPTLPETP